MPKYRFALTNGKSLVLEGDSQPSDTEVEELAKAQGVTLAPAETAPTPTAPAPASAPKAAPAPEIPFQFNEKLKESHPYLTGAIEGAIGGAEGLRRGVVRFPSRMVEGIGNALSDPMGTLKQLPYAVAGIPQRAAETIRRAGSDPVGFGEAVGDIEGNLALAAMGAGATGTANMTPLEAAGSAAKGVASAAERHPALAGAAIGAAHSGIPGAIEGAAIGSVGGRPVIRILNKLADKLAPEAEETTTAAPKAVPRPVRQGTVVGEQPNEGAIEGELIGGEKLPTVQDRIRRGQAEWMAQNRGLPPNTAIPQPPSNIPDPSFVRGVPAEVQTANRGMGLPAPASAGQPALPPGRTIRIAGPSSRPDPSFVRGVPAEAATVEAPAPLRPEPPATTPAAAPAPTTFESEVKRLSAEGLDAKAIAQRLKDAPELKSAGNATQRTNIVRRARGTEAGQLSSELKKRLDADIAKLKTTEDMQNYLDRAPNGQVFNYVKQKLGL